MTSPDTPPLSRRELRQQSRKAQTPDPATDAPDVIDAGDSQPATDAAPTAADIDLDLDDARDAEVAVAPVSATRATQDMEDLFSVVPDASPSVGVSAGQATPTSRTGRIALAWLDESTLTARRAPETLAAATAPYIPVIPGLTGNETRTPAGDLAPSHAATVVPLDTDDVDAAPATRRRGRAAGIVVPLVVVAALAGGYVAATQLWSLDNVTPTLDTADAVTVTGDAAAIDWPANGIAGVGVEGATPLASSDDVLPMASITKVITVLMVLDQKPLEVGEQGEVRDITYADRQTYWSYLNRGESSLNVPVGGTLSEYQLIQGALIYSAGNYVDMLASDLWPTEAEFATAANAWLADQGIDGITMTETTGIDPGNTATGAALIQLASLAMKNPVVAEVVGTESAEIPGVGTIDNTNALLTSVDGVVGIKTGYLDGQYNLLAAKNITVGDDTTLAYAAVLGQTTDAARFDEAADLLDQAESAIATQTVAAGTVVGTVTTPWGTSADAVTENDLSVALWGDATASTDATLELDDARSAGSDVGTVSLDGAWATATSPVSLSASLGEPDFWWRLTHPLDLLGWS